MHLGRDISLQIAAAPTPWAARPQHALASRSVHSDVLKYCRAELVQAAFGGKNPILAINDRDGSEQSGFLNLLVGLFGAVRSPLAHNAKIEWAMDEQDALDTLTLASLVHRKLDRARRRP